MPGLIGFAGLDQIENAGDFLAKMARALEPSDSYRRHLYAVESVGLGLVAHRFGNSCGQPIWNEERTICAVMEGELYDYRSLKRELVERGHTFTHHCDAEFFLHLYEEFGENFVIQLNGAFCAAIWDRRANRLMLVNDRLGLQPLYYASYNNSLLFSSGVRALLVYPGLPKAIDRVAIAGFLTFDHALDDRTLLESVRLLPQGSILVFQDQRVEITRYWEARYPVHYALRTEADWMDELLHHMEKAVQRQAAHDELPEGLLLSGGLDSRFLLPYLSKFSQDRPLSTFTWGIPGCDDARSAADLARIVGVKHNFFELQPGWLLDKAEEAVRDTDGMGNLVNLHALATLEQEAESVNVLYKGFLGDAMMGFGLRHQFWAAYDDPTAFQAHFQVHTDQGVISFHMNEHERLFTSAFRNEVGSAVKESYMAGMKASGSDLMADQRNYFDFYQRVPRMTIKGVEVARSRMIVRLPFADNDLVDFSLTIPPGLRYERRLVKNAFIRAFPRLAQVPITETGYPMMFCARDIVMRTNQFFRWHMRSAGLKWVKGEIQRPTKRYDLWMRTVLRGWVEATLLDGRMFERGYYEPDYIRQLVAKHMEGENHTVQLGGLLSIEIWHRLFID